MQYSVVSLEPNLEDIKPYLVALQAFKDSYSPSWTAWINWLKFGEQKPDYENFKLYMDYLTEMGAKVSTRNTYRAMCIQRLLSIFAAHNEGDGESLAAYKGVLKSVKSFKKQRSGISPLKVLSEKEIKLLIVRAPIKVQLMTEVMYYTACRVEELVNMKWSDFGANQKIIEDKKVMWLRDFFIIGKGSKERNMVFQDALHRRLRKHRSGDTYVFTTNRGTKYSTRGVQKLIKRWGFKILERSVNPHMFRHSRATHLVERGADIRALSDFLGHGDPKITIETYIHTRFKKQQLSLWWREKWTD